MPHSEVLAAVLSTYAEERLVVDPAATVEKAKLLDDLNAYVSKKGYPPVDAAWLGRLLSARFGHAVRPCRMGPRGHRVQAYGGLALR